jgi:hypothetical protein
MHVEIPETSAMKKSCINGQQQSLNKASDPSVAARKQDWQSFDACSTIAAVSK